MTPTDLFNKVWKTETTNICNIPTYRGTAELDNTTVNSNLIDIRNYFQTLADNFSAHHNLSFVPFQWTKKGLKSNFNPTDDDCKDSDFWVFGFRFGPENASRKISIICHLDTVPASASTDWDPLNPSVEPDVEYPAGSESPQDFLVGRGCIDDKGPAVSAFIVARALLHSHDSVEAMNDTTFEIIFDTSEETDMSTPHYMEDPDTVVPDFGVVYDAQWCVRAEKGGERPVFTIPATPTPSEGLYVASLITAPDNSVNTVPDWAEAIIKGPYEDVANFFQIVNESYSNFVPDDDPDYNKAQLESSMSSDETGAPCVILKTLVSGAQHGSAPEENRANGANPLVSLANYLASLLNTKMVKPNAVTAMTEFIRWTWGTQVFGQGACERLLYKNDEVFREDEKNGTTYAVTKTEMDGESITMYVDIRYAIPHHKTTWTGEEGLLEPKESKFDGIFLEVTTKFNNCHEELASVSYTTKCVFAPDIRDPNNDNFQLVSAAYKEVMGYEPPMFAIGGGTDAKGYTFLLGVGPLMGKVLGPPINYHGIGEGAPITDMGRSTHILFNVMSAQIKKGSSNCSAERVLKNKVLARMKQLRSQEYKQCCNH